MNFTALLTLVATVYCSGKNIRIFAVKEGNGIAPSSFACDATISNRNTGEKLDLHCSGYGYGSQSCNTESKDSSFGNYDARIMECNSNGWSMYAKIAVWDRVGQYMAIKEFRDSANQECWGDKVKYCQYTFLVDEYWGEA
ncbi:hypothetical protein CONCODRAFT_70021 [Conidiobolus coronatus NRRL 28638]|uniref:Cyanovirin-N domain-containing protein n=1 Tax=Conidiobolus coronatus (strain ATCC 28846 / CBS 209.66 / NRRL 28638) TaxID=796925 RepID=A0A137P8A1_CONC2|nr:hypothetical protein CONCODRAFT_70021 [Conidiobolus coronatus NRRL 28638]|eukprot:KXN71174.1 hypothetical protein CONCODRAFT_70021 [Conidiobolus coronatus NRRL 28638]